MSRSRVTGSVVGLFCATLILIFFSNLVAGEKVPTPVLIDVPALDPEHTVFHGIVQQVVRESGVDYGLLRESLSQQLDRYRQQLAHAEKPSDEITPNKQAYKKSFYINAYNALTLYQVIRFLPEDQEKWNDWSVRKVSGFWKSYTYEVAGEWISLDTIEHKILRPMGDPRVHFAVNCASKSCPPLRSEAYAADAIEKQLASQTQIFLHSPYHLRFKDGRLRVNKILSWFGGDFKKSGGVSVFIQEHIQDGAIKTYLENGGKIKFFSYDWKLNLK